jgi:tryptophan-rich sensory protein
MTGQIMKTYLMLAGFLLLCFAVAGAGGYVTSTSVSSWYPTLNKPSWTPSGRTIGLVWNVLFLLMAISGWLVWKQSGLTSTTRVAFTFFAIQLALNLLWSVCFFGLRSPGLAMLELPLLEASVITTLIYFWRISWVPGLMLVPYALWVVFAGVLNFMFWWLNRTSG